MKILFKISEVLLKKLAGVYYHGFKISDIDKLILALIFRFRVILVLKKLDVKFSCIFMRYKDTP